MASRPITTLIAVICTSLVLMTSAALAAQSTTSLNVRSGPSRHHHVVDVLYPGEHVDVETCRQNGWCFINHRGHDGWVSARYLRNAYTYRDHHQDYRPQRRQRYHAQPRRQAPRHHNRRSRRNNNANEFDFSINGPNFGFSIRGNQPRDCVRRYGRVICR